MNEKEKYGKYEEVGNIEKNVSMIFWNIFKTSEKERKLMVTNY